MCIIVDANAAGDLGARTPDGRPVLEWLLNHRRRSGLIAGGRLLQELDKGGLRETLRELKAAGRLHSVPDNQIEAEERKLVATGICVSNDPHVVALIIVSGCDLIFTKDQKLHQDLKNRQISPKPVRIYQTARHVRLLGRCTCV